MARAAAMHLNAQHAGDVQQTRNSRLIASTLHMSLAERAPRRVAALGARCLRHRRIAYLARPAGLFFELDALGERDAHVVAPAAVSGLVDCEVEKVLGPVHLERRLPSA